jgi:hypothetical protein
MVIFLLGVANDDVPWTDFPTLNEAIEDVRILADKIFGWEGIGGAENEKRSVRRVGQRTSQNEFAASVSLARQVKVLLTVGGAPGDEIGNNLAVEECEVRHGNSSVSTSSSLA